MAVRMNRGERQQKFLSNVVKGEAVQLTPNGVAFSKEPEAPANWEISGLNSGTPPVKREWNGNRSGE